MAGFTRLCGRSRKAAARENGKSSHRSVAVAVKGAKGAFPLVVVSANKERGKEGFGFMTLEQRWAIFLTGGPSSRWMDSFGDLPYLRKKSIYRVISCP